MEMFAWPKQITFKSFYISRGSPLGKLLGEQFDNWRPRKKTLMSPSDYTYCLHFYTSSFILLSSLTIVILNIFLTYEELWIFASMKTFSHWSLLSFPSDSLLTWKKIVFLQIGHHHHHCRLCCWYLVNHQWWSFFASDLISLKVRIFIYYKYWLFQLQWNYWISEN